MISFLSLGRFEIRHSCDANVMVSRVSLRMLLGWCKLCDQMQEQPMSSVIFAHPRQKQVAKATQWNCLVTSMGAFGAATEKPTKLWSTCTWLNSLKKPYTASRQPGKTLVSRDAAGGITGIPGALKESQTYPKGFGTEVGRLYTQWQQRRAPGLPFPFQTSSKLMPGWMPSFTKLLSCAVSGNATRGKSRLRA